MDLIFPKFFTVLHVLYTHYDDSPYSIFGLYTIFIIHIVHNSLIFHKNTKYTCTILFWFLCSSNFDVILSKIYEPNNFAETDKSLTHWYSFEYIHAFALDYGYIVYSMSITHV